jgi:hypothetical protein
MIVENIDQRALKPRSGEIILSYLRHFLTLSSYICYNPIMPSAL